MVKEKINRFSNLKSLRKLSSKEIDIISDHFHIRTYANDEIIYKIDTPALVVYLLVEGSVILSDQNNKIISISNGEFFGNLALNDQNKRPYSAMTTSDSIIAGIYHKDFYDLFDKYQSIKNKIIDELIITK
tara:strand:- start:547 stop:939 length:393 start_codon:yes stop_codon:yes gene_type:complete